MRSSRASFNADTNEERNDQEIHRTLDSISAFFKKATTEAVFKRKQRTSDISKAARILLVTKFRPGVQRMERRILGSHELTQIACFHGATEPINCRYKPESS